MQYTVYGTVKSRTFRVLWMLEELGLPYSFVSCAPRSEALKKISPLGKVPVLVDGDAVLRDSTAILTYLSDKHGALTHKAGTIERAQQDAWTYRILDELDSLLWTAARHSFILTQDLRVPAIKDSLKVEYAANLDRMIPEMVGPFVMGSMMTLPDILLCHCGGWAVTAGFPEAPQGFRDYARRLRARPAFARAAAAE